MNENTQEKKIFQEEIKKIPQQEVEDSKKKWYWIAALLIVIVIVVLFYQFVYKRLPKVNENDIFEPTIYTPEQQKAILGSLDDATPSLSPEERTSAVNTFLGTELTN